MDQSGVLDRVEEHIAKYDTNKDGTFAVAEVKAIVEELEKEEQQTKALKKVPAPAPAMRCPPPPVSNRRWPQIIGGVIVLSMVGFLCMFFVAWAANE